MALEPFFTKRFQKDLKLSEKRGKDTSKIRAVILLLINEQRLIDKYKDHALIGNYAGHRECHIEPDWLLIYRVHNKAISFERNGTHSDLFK